MKSFIILFICIFISSVEANAQFGNMNGGQGGMRNNVMPTPQQTPKEPTAEEIEKNRGKQIEGYMNELKSDLNLDELQYIAIKNDLMSNSKRIDIVLKSDYTEEEKSKEIKSIQEKIEKSILSYLNASQKEKYLLLKTQKAEGKGDKKKKKTRGKAEQSETKEKDKETLSKD